MKTSLTPEDLSKAIQFLKDNAIPGDEVCLGRLVGWINAHRVGKQVIDKGNEIFPLSDFKDYCKKKEELQKGKPLNPKIGYTYHDGVNTKTYRGYGAWKTTLLYDSREFMEKKDEKI